MTTFVTHDDDMPGLPEMHRNETELLLADLDALSTAVLDGTLVKVFSWYDNEMGYSQRLFDLTERLRPFVGR
jgi:glyceraldehyde-3-phosphate dehydrogenase/erythrose-4-phosphate dehydrogenase